MHAVIAALLTAAAPGGVAPGVLTVRAEVVPPCIVRSAGGGVAVACQGRQPHLVAPPASPPRNGAAPTLPPARVTIVF